MPPQTYVEGFHNPTEFNKMTFLETNVDDEQHGGKRHWSIIGLGASAFGNVFGTVDGEECNEVVHRYLKAGVNVIDTAPWYGQGKSEEFLGRALKDVPRKAYYLHTKVGRYDPDRLKMFDFRASTVRESVENSMRRMGLNYIDTIQEFAPTLQVILEETLPELQRMKDEGKVGAIGITGYPLGPLLEVAKESPVKLDTILSYCRFAMYDDSLIRSGAAKEFSDLGLSLISAAPLGMGLLTSTGVQDWHPSRQDLKDRCEKVVEFCHTNQIDPARLALGYCLERISQTKNPDIKTLIFSVTGKHVAEKNLSLALNESPLSPSEKEACQTIVTHKEYLGDPSISNHWENIEVTQYWIEVICLLDDGM